MNVFNDCLKTDTEEHFTTGRDDEYAQFFMFEETSTSVYRLFYTRVFIANFTQSLRFRIFETIPTSTPYENNTHTKIQNDTYLQNKAISNNSYDKLP